MGVVVLVVVVITVMNWFIIDFAIFINFRLALEKLLSVSAKELYCCF